MMTFGAITLTWQDPVHAWKAGPGEVMTVENKQTKARTKILNPELSIQPLLKAAKARR